MQRANTKQRVYSEADAAAVLERSPRYVRRLAEAGKVARFYRPQRGARDQVVYDAEQIDGLRQDTPAIVLRRPAAQLVTPPRIEEPAAPAPGLMHAAFGRLMERLNAPPTAPALPPAPPKEWLMPAEAAAEKGFTEAWLRRMIAAGRVPVIRDGAGYKVHRSVLDSLADLAMAATELRAELRRRKGAAHG